MKKVVLSFCLLFMFGCGGGTSTTPAASNWPGPVGDETPLVRIKANPRDYIGRPVITWGTITLSDYYNFGYSDATDTHYALHLWEWGQSPLDNKGLEAYLYIPRPKGRKLVGLLTKYQEKHGGENSGLGMRVKVALTRYDAAAGASDAWDMLELLDVQFVDPKTGAWGPSWEFGSDDSK